MMMMMMMMMMMVLSCTVSEIRRLIGKKLRIFLPLSHSAPPLPVFPSEFCVEVKDEENRVMALSSGKDRVIVA